MPSRAVRSVKSAVSVKTTARLRKSVGKLLQSSSGRRCGAAFVRRRRNSAGGPVRRPPLVNIDIRRRRSRGGNSILTTRSARGRPAFHHRGVAHDAEVLLGARERLARRTSRVRAITAMPFSGDSTSSSRAGGSSLNVVLRPSAPGSVSSRGVLIFSVLARRCRSPSSASTPCRRWSGSARRWAAPSCRRRARRPSCARWGRTGGDVPPWPSRIRRTATSCEGERWCRRPGSRRWSLGRRRRVGGAPAALAAGRGEQAGRREKRRTSCVSRGCPCAPGPCSRRRPSSPR